MFFLAALSPTLMLSQVNGTLPIVRHNPDVLSASMGLTPGSMLSGGHYIYSQPTSFLYSEKKLTVSYSLTLSPVKDMAHSSPFYNAVSGAWRIKRHLLLAGFRYQGKNSIVQSTATGDGRTIHPMDITFDFGYAYRINDHISTYVIGHFVESYIGKIAFTGGGSAGVSYRSSCVDEKVNYGLGLSLRNLGGLVQYGKKGGKYSMPGSATLAGGLDYQLSPKWRLLGGCTFDYLLQPASAGYYTVAIGGGIDYSRVTGLLLGARLAKGSPSLSLGGYVNILNYCSLTLGGSLDMRHSSSSAISLGVNCNI